jgi:thiamine phosphate synthase YjbQ (UPF0047 family)
MTTSSRPSTGCFHATSGSTDTATAPRATGPITSPSLTVPVTGGRLALGTWQSICLLDPNEDNATRTVRLSFLEG